MTAYTLEFVKEKLAGAKKVAEAGDWEAVNSHERKAMVAVVHMTADYHLDAKRAAELVVEWWETEISKGPRW